MRQKLKTIIALILVILMVLGISAYIVVPYVSAESAAGLQDELSGLQSNRAKLEKKLSQIENQRDSELEKKAIVDQQINSLQSEIDVANRQLNSLDDELKKANDKLESATEQYKDAFESSKDRIRAAYEGGTVSYLQIILSSGSVTDFITRLEIVKEIMAYDRSLIKKLNDSRAAIEKEQKAIQEKQQAQKKATDALKDSRNTLAAKQNISNNLVKQFNEKSDDLTAQIEEAERQEADLRAQIQKQLSQMTQEEAAAQIPVSDGFMYPLASKWNIITDPFGYRVHPVTGVYKLHTGCDISGSGIRGANVYASKSGTVLKSGYHSAYGNYVVLNHGDGTATLYGHMNSTPLVSVGSLVTQGQVIGYVGSTGYSTGAHLHFEIMVNGEYVDPIPYFRSSVNFVYY